VEVVGFMVSQAAEEREDTKCILSVNEEDHFYIEIDQIQRRIVVHMTASPTRTNFMRRWILIMTEIAKLNIERDAPIDVIYDYTETKPVQPNLKVIMFTKALGAVMIFPNVQTWRVIPGDPTNSGFLQKFSREMSSSWLPLRTSEKLFRSVEEAEGYLDEFRAGEEKKTIGNIGKKLKQMGKGRSRGEFSVSRSDKTDSAKWKEKTINPLTHAQLRIRDLCDAYMKGEISPDEFERELPPVLSARDREKRKANL
jgi:hypothetical protein